MFANIQCSFMEFVFEMDDLWILGISEKYRRLTEYIGCWVKLVWYVTVANLNLI